MLIPVIYFLAGLLFLIKGGDWFVDGATGIAHRFHLPELLIGATVVSIGTTLPEVMVSATSALGGHSEIAYGNALGSVICNTALIAAVTIAVRPGRVDKEALVTPTCFFFVSAVFFAGFAYLTGQFSRTAGLSLLIIFVVYLCFTIWQMTERSRQESAGGPNDSPPKIRSLLTDILLLVAGAACIAVGANLLVDNGTLIAEAMGVPESVIALTFVALGTSLPELVTAITSLAKGHSALSLGNVIGANVLNLALVCGLSVTIAPFAVPASSTWMGMNASFVLDIPVMFAVMLILSVPAILKQRLYRAQGIMLLIIYFAYCVLQFAM